VVIRPLPAAGLRPRAPKSSSRRQPASRTAPVNLQSRRHDRPRRSVQPPQGPDDGGEKSARQQQVRSIRYWRNLKKSARTARSTPPPADRLPGSAPMPKITTAPLKARLFEGAAPQEKKRGGMAANDGRRSLARAADGLHSHQKMVLIRHAHAAFISRYCGIDL